MTFSARFIFMVCLITLVPIAANSQETAQNADLQRLVGWMTGSFSSEQQSQDDTSFYDIQLEMVRIWRYRTDGYWLYVEQAVATNPHKPYRQRVYQVTQIDDSTFESAVYTMEEPLRFAGAWKEDNPLAALTLDSLVEKTGCSVYLKMQGDTAFAGSTIEGDCKTDFRGATYVMSEVRVTPDFLVSLDRGHDAEGNQAWGALTSGYIFRKKVMDK